MSTSARPPAGGPSVARGEVAGARLSGDRSQQTFDALLWALAEPGTIRRLPPSVVELDVAAVAWLGLALADVDTPVAVAGPVEDPRVGMLADLVRDATGAPVVDVDRAWIVMAVEQDPALLDQVAVGDALHPENGARLALPVDWLGRPGSGPEPAVEVVVEGPGVPGQRSLAVGGLDGALAERLGRATAEFPAGFDTWLFAPDGAVAAVPRSCRVTVMVPSGAPRHQPADGPAVDDGPSESTEVR